MHPSVVVGAYRTASSLARAVPERVADAASFALGSAVAAIPGDRRRIVERNLRRALGPSLHGRELRRNVREVYRSYARYYIESFRLPGTPTPMVAVVSLPWAGSASPKAIAPIAHAFIPPPVP